jgi:hypothetical protein
MDIERIQLDASTQSATTGRYNDNKIELPRCYITLGIHRRNKNPQRL